MLGMPTRRTLARMTTATLTVVAVTFLSACTGDDDPEPAPPTTAATQSGPSASATPTGSPDVEPVVATLPDGRGTVDVVVRSLVLDPNGTTMTLRVDFTPHLTDPEGAMSLSAINRNWFIFPELLDREHLKRYSVIEGEGAQDWLTNKDAKTEDGEPLGSWFVYAAPEDDVDSFTLTMDGWALEIPDVEVTQ
jgi:hypothetical protein